MPAKFNGGTAAMGVAAYQDSDDPNQFFYLPCNADCVMGETLSDFAVTYWGVGKKFLIDDGEVVKSSVGAVLAGRAAIDISQLQREKIIKAIKKAYNINNPALLPLNLKNVTVQPVVGYNTLRLGPDSDVKFPSTVQIGQSFQFLVGTGNSLFAQFVGAATVGNGFTPNPSFGINIVGQAEFRGAPWKVKVTADLSQVWQYTREQFNLSVGFGWFQVPLAKVDDIMIELNKSQVIKFEFTEGSLETEKYGRQIFETAKEIFEAVNEQSEAGVGFFKFEPNPDPPTAENPDSGLSLPWRMYINGGYGKESIKSTQKMHYEKEIVYNGNFFWNVPCAMTLAVSCNDTTGSYFRDLGDLDIPCITKAKADAMQERLEKEYDAKSKLETKYLYMFIEGDLSEEEYFRRIDELYNGKSTEDLVLAPEQKVIVANAQESMSLFGRHRVFVGA